MGTFPFTFSDGTQPFCCNISRAHLDSVLPEGDYRSCIRLSDSMEGNTGVSPRSIKLVVICAVFLPLAVVATGLRLWARRLKRVSLSLNDYLIVAALVGASPIIEMRS